MSNQELRQADYEAKVVPLLNERGINACRLAKECGFSPVVFTDWKKGKSKPKIDKLMKIADRLGVDIGTLI